MILFEQKEKDIKMENFFGKISDWNYKNSSSSFSHCESESESENQIITFQSEFQGKVTFKGKTKKAKLYLGILEGENFIFVGEFDGLNFLKGKRKIKNKDIIIEEHGFFEQNNIAFGYLITSFEECKILFRGYFRNNNLVYGEKKILDMNFFESGKFKEGKLIYGFENENEITSIASPFFPPFLPPFLPNGKNKNGKNKNDKNEIENPFVFSPPLNEKEEIEDLKITDSSPVKLMPAFYVDYLGELHFMNIQKCSKIEGDGFYYNNLYIGARFKTDFERGIFQNDKLIKGIIVNEKNEKKII